MLSLILRPVLQKRQGRVVIMTLMRTPKQTNNQINNYMKQHTLQKVARWLYMIMFAIITIFLNACGSVEEPTEQNLGRTTTITRSTQQNELATLSESEAIIYAKKALNVDESQTDLPTIEYVLAQKEESKTVLPSDTMAYVISFGNSGSALIANCNSYYPVLATFRVKPEVKNGKVNLSLFNRLEDFLVNRSLNKNRTNPDYCLNPGCGHYLHGEFDVIDVNIESPFDATVKKYHPGCKAGSVPGCSALALAYTQKDLKYKKNQYNFKILNTLIGQGPNTCPIGTLDVSPLGLNINEYPTSSYSYEGAANEFSQLIYDLGEDMYTSYNDKNSTTYLSDAYRALKKMGCELSPFRSSFDVQNIWDLILDGHIIMQEIFEKETGKKSCILITGGENIYEHYSPEEVHYLSLWIKSFDETYIDLGIMCSMDSEFFPYIDYNLKQYFGIKRQPGAYASKHSIW